MAVRDSEETTLCSHDTLSTRGLTLLFSSLATQGWGDVRWGDVHLCLTPQRNHFVCYITICQWLVHPFSHQVVHHSESTTRLRLSTSTLQQKLLRVLVDISCITILLSYHWIVKYTLLDLTVVYHCVELYPVRTR